MAKEPFRAFLLTLVGCCLYGYWLSSSFRDEQRKFHRVRSAAKEKDALLQRLFAGNGLIYPSKVILLRAFKKEGVLEFWVENSAGTSILANSIFNRRNVGDLGTEEAFWGRTGPCRLYEWTGAIRKAISILAFKSVIQTRQTELGWESNSGGDIFQHGNCVTIGWIPISDDGIKEIYCLAVLARNSGNMHIPMQTFPLRLTTESLGQLAATRNDRDLTSFWMNLKEGCDCFEKNHRPAFAHGDRGGRYVFSAKSCPA